MVPLKLSLKNFLSYGSPTTHIDFEPYHLICLSGKNGHGKSALLDAITWVLWGQGRKLAHGTKPDESFVRLGNTNMMVSLDFTCNTILYRVRRELTISSKTHTSLDFGIVDPHNQQVKSLTDKTIRATQAKIIQTLGLDYDSFINSVFLRQGASNEFSKKSPKERKEILCAILGIHKLEDIKKKAVEKTRTLTTQKETLLPLYEKLAHEITQKKHLQELLDQLTLTEKNLREKNLLHHELLKQAEQALHTQQQDHETVKASLHAQEKLEMQLRQHHTDLQEARAEFKKNLLHKITMQKPSSFDYQKANAEFLELQHKERELEALQQQALQLHEKIYQQEVRLKTAATQALHQLDLQQQEIKSRTALHEQRLQEYLVKKRNLIAQIAGKKEKIDMLRVHKYEKYKETYQRLVTKKNNLSAACGDLEATLKKILTAESPCCPTCVQPLPAHQKKMLCVTLQHQADLKSAQLTRLHALLPALKNLVIELHRQTEVAQEIALVHNKMREIEQQEQEIITQCKQEMEQLAALEKNKEELRTHNILADPEYEKLIQERAQITHHISLYSQLKDKKNALIEQLHTRPLDNHSYESLMLVMQQIKKNVHLIITHIRGLKEQADEHRRHHAVLQKKIAECPYTREKVVLLKNEYALEAQELHRIVRELGSTQEQLTRLEEQEKEYLRLTKHLEGLTAQSTLYQAIAQAVGKDGIQALLIEQVIPEIEYEANLLLSKLTDNQTHLFIESLRDLKSGKTKETLDIHISDATGMRPYELFSGGEAFRIDFALRIALSKLLARRAGATLQTLIIDEGFGSQDEEGISHIMETLYKIQDDFAKIIIVSHLPSMKDQFPVHFVVQKSAQGSGVKVVQQG